MSFRALFLLPLSALLALAQDPTSTARKAVDLILAEKYSDVSSMMTADLAKDLSPANLAKIGAQMKTYGALDKVGDAQASKSGPNTIVVVPVNFANRTLNVRLIVNAAGQISLFVVQPAQVAWQRPAYSE